MIDHASSTWSRSTTIPKSMLVAVAQARDVQPDAVEDHRHRVVGLQPRAGAVERRRAGQGRWRSRSSAAGATAAGRTSKVTRAARAATAGGMNRLASASRSAGSALWRSLARAQDLVGALEAPPRVGLVGRDRDEHRRDAVAERPASAHGAYRDGDHRDERLGGQLAALEQPRAQRAGADRDDGVVDRDAGRGLDRLDAVERQRAEGEAAVRRDAAVEARARRARRSCRSRTPPSACRGRARCPARDAADGRRAGHRRRRRAPSPAAAGWRAARAAPSAGAAAPAACGRATPARPGTRSPSSPASARGGISRPSGARSNRMLMISAPDMPSTAAWWILVSRPTRPSSSPWTT